MLNTFRVGNIVSFVPLCVFDIPRYASNISLNTATQVVLQIL